MVSFCLDACRLGMRIEDEDRSLGRNERVAAEHVELEHGVIAGARRIADVDRIEQDTGAVVARYKLLAHARQPVGAQRHHVDPGLDIGCAIDRSRRRGAEDVGFGHGVPPWRALPLSDAGVASEVSRLIAHFPARGVHRSADRRNRLFRGPVPT